VAALFGVILGFVMMDVMSPINCQVGTVFYSRLNRCDPDWLLRSQGRCIFRNCEYSHLSQIFLLPSVCLTPSSQYFIQFFSFLSMTASSLLIVLRVCVLTNAYYNLAKIRHSLRLPALSFGTKIRLLWRQHSVYGRSILHSSFMVNNFSHACRRSGTEAHTDTVCSQVPCE
jgi:hypothetical protein